MSFMKSTAETFSALSLTGQTKAAQSFSKSLSLGFLAGAYIGFGAFFALKVANGLDIAYWGSLQKLIFGGVFPVGLLLVVVAGGDLFTGNCMTMPMAVMTRQASVWGLIKNWCLSYGSNFAGSLFLAYFLGYAAGVYFDVWPDGHMPLAAGAVKAANTKCSLAFGTAFYRGLGCNWLVCLGVFVAAAAPDVVSKIIALWPPVTLFVAMGFEHCVANMTFVPLGIFIGQSSTYIQTAAQHSAAMPALTAAWDTFLINNLIPVTLGNIAGGLIFVAMLYFAAVYKDIKKD